MSPPSPKADLLRVAASYTEEELLVLDRQASHYVSRVHRLPVGARLTLFDPERGLECEGSLEALSKEGATVRCSSWCPSAAPGWPGLHLLLGLGKGDKLEQVIRSVVPLGVGRITPLECERSVVSLSQAASRRLSAKAERWRAVAVETCRQCGRGATPKIDLPRSLEAALSQSVAEPTPAASPSGAGSLRQSAWTGHLFLDARAAAVPLPHLLGPLVVGKPSLGLWVGPEGGFSPAELELFQRWGVRGASLGALVLRTELAPVVAFSQVLAHLVRDAQS